MLVVSLLGEIPKLLFEAAVLGAGSLEPGGFKLPAAGVTPLANLTGTLDTAGIRLDGGARPLRFKDASGAFRPDFDP